MGNDLLPARSTEDRPCAGPIPSWGRRHSSARILRRALIRSGVHYRGGSAPTVRHLIEPLGAEASGLAAALLALPFLSPVSLGPLTMPASAVIAILGWQILLRREGSPLPERLLNVSVPHTAHRAMSAVARRTHRWIHRLSRPRLAHLVDGRRGSVLCGAGLIVGAILLAVPIPLLPLTNTFPAIGILLFALGRLERDGLLTVLGSAALGLTILIFGAVGVTASVLGAEAVRNLLPFASGT